MTFQTQNENLRAVCFSPEKRKRLAQFKTDGVSCVISNLIQSNEKEVKLTNNSTVKPKTVAFPKNEDYEYCDIDTIINEIELLRCVNIIVKVIHIEDVQSSRNLMLQEYLVTDDGENNIPLTMFEDLTQVLKKKYHIQKFDLKNKKKLRSTRLTKVEVCTDEKQIPESESLVQLNLAPNLVIESCKLSYIVDDSFLKQRICDNCKSLLNGTTNKLISWDTCSSVCLRKSFRYV